MGSLVERTLVEVSIVVSRPLLNTEQDAVVTAIEHALPGGFERDGEYIESLGATIRQTPVRADV